MYGISGHDIHAGAAHIGPLPSGDGLTANIIRFAALLRQADIPVFFSSILDALKSLPLADITEIQTFYSLLRSLFICRKEHLDRFEELFRQFWLPEDEAVPTVCPAFGSEREEDPVQEPAPRIEKRLSHRMTDEAVAQRKGTTDTYSPLALHRKTADDGVDYEPSEALYESVAKLLDRLSRRVSRRYRYAPHGSRVSLNRLMRRNIRFGGELMLLDFKRRKVKQRPVVVFCDVSGSMDIHTLMAFQFIHALNRIVSRTEIFFFSTELTRVTRHFQWPDFSETLRKIPHQVSDWKGGTRIGHCLKTFNDTYGSSRLSRRSIVMIFSDGWDRGEIGLLRRQMAIIKQKAYRILWLNPLLGTRDYRPVCRGMRAALPYTDYFLAASRLYDFHDTERVLERLVVD